MLTRSLWTETAWQAHSSFRGIITQTWLFQKHYRSNPSLSPYRYSRGHKSSPPKSKLILISMHPCISMTYICSVYTLEPLACTGRNPLFKASVIKKKSFTNCSICLQQPPTKQINTYYRFSPYAPTLGFFRKIVLDPGPSNTTHFLSCLKYTLG